MIIEESKESKLPSYVNSPVNCEQQRKLVLGVQLSLSSPRSDQNNLTDLKEAARPEFDQGEKYIEPAESPTREFESDREIEQPLEPR